MFSIDELKQIQLYRQHLTDKADKHTVCHDLNGIQAQFTVNMEVITTGRADGLHCLLF